MRNTYIALLRGINVGGQKKMKMIELRAVMAEEGFQNVKTYIQSGNIVFDCDETNQEKLENIIVNAIWQHFGFNVTTLVIKYDKLKRIVQSNPFTSVNYVEKRYYVMLKRPPEDLLVKDFKELHFPNEDFHLTDTCVYLLCNEGYGKAKLNNNLIEKKLNVEATTRNEKTMKKLLQMST
ncbi:DUF1697 domain-containing protein [Allomuricauda sp. F6463D]|uniref:DUF1697 domain-containing protein n=1 Tax=Allomuricauda sp. F6463D TaxID=2926409 RepID=UPI001FF4AE02|nr:DUF1697 domain-containing protein [Muricauda sp. F6463D]MCK0161541.1 DUF1697 domain-containing protein [Muricauda sp. F6463D]